MNWYLWLAIPPLLIGAYWFLGRAKSNRKHYIERPLVVLKPTIRTGLMLTGSSWWENQRVRKAKAMVFA